MNYRIESTKFLLTRYKWPLNGNCMLLNNSSKFLVLTEHIYTSSFRGLKLKSKTKELALGKIKFCKVTTLETNHSANNVSKLY